MYIFAPSFLTNRMMLKKMNATDRPDIKCVKTSPKGAVLRTFIQELPCRIAAALWRWRCRSRFNLRRLNVGNSGADAACGESAPEMPDPLQPAARRHRARFCSRGITARRHRTRFYPRRVRRGGMKCDFLLQY
jgi:hypothetical protein